MYGKIIDKIENNAFLLDIYCRIAGSQTSYGNVNVQFSMEIKKSRKEDRPQLAFEKTENEKVKKSSKKTLTLLLLVK